MAGNAAWAAAVTLDQLGTCAVHRQSDAADPKLLRLKERPNAVRDNVLTQRHFAVVNPLCVFYCPAIGDAVCNSVFAWVFAASVSPHVHWRHLAAVSVLGGLAGGTAWAYQAKNWPRRLNTRSDVTAASNAAFSSLCGFSLMVPFMQVPFVGIPLIAVTAPFAARLWWDEYWHSTLFPPPAYDPVVHNGGMAVAFIVGLAYGLIFARTYGGIARRNATHAEWLFSKVTVEKRFTP